MMTRALRLLCVTAVVALLSVAAVSCANRSRPVTAAHRGQSPPAPSRTLVTKFTPYSAAGTLTVPVAARVRGYCWTGSIATPVAGAYRCLVGNDIADPCFAPPRASAPATLACLPDPWSGARLLSLTKPLPRTAPIGTPGHPWAVQLANGARCIAATGTVQAVAGVSLNLLCADGMAAGGLDTNAPQWHVRYGAVTGASLRLVAVRAAWHG